MNKPLFILLNVMVLLTGACASQTTTPSSTQVAAAAKLSPSQEYQNYVMQHANGVHAEVHWYNTPDDDDVAKYDFSKD
jgi:hypothetical protein